MTNKIPEMPKQKDYKDLTLFDLTLIQKFPFIEEDFDAINMYGILSKIKDYLNTIIANEQIVTENQKNVYNSFTDLHNYTENYFTNLNVQNEINNKLDKMVEDGTLNNIIFNYTKLIKTFNTTIDFINSNELFFENQKIKTLGYYNENDGGEALFLIRKKSTNDTNSPLSILLNNNLVAELIINNNLVNIKQIGAKGDNTSDDTQFFKLLINNKLNIYVPSGNYIINDTLVLDYQIDLFGDGNNSRLIYKGNGFLFHSTTNLANKPSIRKLYLTGTESNSLLHAFRDAFGSSVIMEDCLIFMFNDIIFRFTSLFDPILRNIRILSSGKILFDTYDGYYNENSFSNNVTFEHVYWTGDPNRVELAFDLNNVRYLHFIGCQFENINKLILAKNNTKNVIFDHSWVENTYIFYETDNSSEGVKAINTNVTLTDKLNYNAKDLDYLHGNDKKTVYVVSNNDDTFNTLRNNDNIVFDNQLIYNKNTDYYPYKTIYQIGSKNSIFNMPVNMTKTQITNSDNLTYQLKSISHYSSAPMLFDVMIDIIYPDYSEKILSVKIWQKGFDNYRVLKVNEEFKTTWQNSDTTKYDEEIKIESGSLTITSTHEMARCEFYINHSFLP